MRQWIIVFAMVSSLLFAEDCAPFSNAKNLVGKEACVVGRVLNVTESRAGNVFLNFCRDYKECGFSAVALKKSNSQLGDLHDLEGKFVELRGPIKSYRGEPEIELTSRDQLKIADDKARMPSEVAKARSGFHAGGGARMPLLKKPRRPKIHIPKTLR